jgi:hypothetical protein
MKLNRFGNFLEGLVIFQKYETDKNIISDGPRILISSDSLKITCMGAHDVGLLIQRGWVYPGDPKDATPNWGFDAPARG